VLPSRFAIDWGFMPMRWLSVAVLLLASSFAQSVCAQADAHGAEYTRLIHDALQEYDAGHWEEARALFARAHVLSPSARTFRALGNADFELRHYVAAVRELEAALQEARNPLSAAQRAEAHKALERARSYVGHVRVEVEPAGAELLLDGHPVEGDELTLDPGDYVLVARAQGRHDGEARFTVQGGETSTVTLHLPVDLGVRGAPESRAPAAPLARTATRDEPSAERSGSVFTRWWFWTAAGLVIAGGVTAAVIASSGSKPDHGADVTVEILGVQR
jgi:hypothetical protein